MVGPPITKERGRRFEPRAWQRDFKLWRVGGGLDVYPYQFSLGFSLRYWRCLYAPTFRVHIGPFKAWLYVTLRGARA